MEEFELSIPQSYDRLKSVGFAYYVKALPGSLDFLPDPEKVDGVYKAKIHHVHSDLKSGVDILDYPGFGDPENLISENYQKVSPRELFLTRELLRVIEHRTQLALPPRISRLDRLLTAKKQNFRDKLASAMAQVVLERFSEDQRSPHGRVYRR
jgi:hypothetical protein